MKAYVQNKALETKFGKWTVYSLYWIKGLTEDKHTRAYIMKLLHRFRACQITNTAFLILNR